MMSNWMYCDVPDVCQLDRKNGEHIPMVIKPEVSNHCICVWSVVINTV